MEKPKVVGLNTDIGSDGVVTTRQILERPVSMKIKPKLKISFTNGIPQDYEGSEGFQTELEGGYSAIISLMEILTNALKEMAKEKEARE